MAAHNSQQCHLEPEQLARLLQAASPSGGSMRRQGIAAGALHARRPAAQGLLTTASKAPGGGYAYNTASVPLLAEALKLAVSTYLLARQRRVAPEAARTTRSLRGAALFVVPSLIYWLHNNVQARAPGRGPRRAQGRAAAAARRTGMPCV